MSELGQIIKDMRHEAGISQITLSRLAGMGDRVVSTYERDIRAPSFHRVESIANVCGYDVDFIKRA